MTATATLSDVEIARQYDVTRAVLDFESTDGLTFADYQAMLEFQIAMRHNHEITDDSTTADTLGNTTLKGKPVEMFSDLWAMYLRTRREMFRYFSEKRLNLRLEDIIILDGLFIKGLIKRNLNVILPVGDRWHEFMFEAKLCTAALGELLATIYALPDEKLIDFFVDRSLGDERVQLISVVHFIEGKNKKRLGRKLLAHLETRLHESYIPEIDVRHYGKLNPSVKPGLDRNNPKHFLPLMRAAGIPDEVSMFASAPGVSFWEMNDDIKNGCHVTGDVILHILGRSVEK